MHAYPAWVGDDGLPLSWRHYLYGMTRLRREAIDRKLDIASAVRAGQSAKDDYKKWRYELEEQL